MLIPASSLPFWHACSSQSSSPTSPSEPSPAPTQATVPVLTLAPDTGSPVGEAVALTYASRAQEAGKIAVAVTGYNLRNQISASSTGLFAVNGTLKWDAAVLEHDGAVGAEDLLGGNSLTDFGRSTAVAIDLKRTATAPAKPRELLTDQCWRPDV